VILLLRGAPGTGKSTTAAALSARLGGPPSLAVVEVDDLRGDLWHVPPALRLDDDERHHLALAQAARIARALLGAGVRRVCVVDTFSDGAVAAFRGALRCSVPVAEIVLHCDRKEHCERLRLRPEVPGVYRDAVAACAMADELRGAGCVVRTTGVAPCVVAEQIAWMLHE
jgi:predicted kinase